MYYYELQQYKIDNYFKDNYHFKNRTWTKILDSNDFIEVGKKADQLIKDGYIVRVFIFEDKIDYTFWKNHKEENNDLIINCYENEQLVKKYYINQFLYLEKASCLQQFSIFEIAAALKALHEDFYDNHDLNGYIMKNFKSENDFAYITVVLEYDFIPHIEDKIDIDLDKVTEFYDKLVKE